MTRNATAEHFYGRRGGGWLPANHNPRAAAPAVADQTCTSCRQQVTRTVQPYWSITARLCPACCVTAADTYDQVGWPARPEEAAA